MEIAEEADLCHFTQSPSNPYQDEWTQQLLAIAFAYNPRRFETTLNLDTFKLIPFDGKDRSTVSVSNHFKKVLDDLPTPFPTDFDTLPDDKRQQWRQYHKVYETMATSCILTACDYSGWFPVEAMVARETEGERGVYWKKGPRSWEGGRYQDWPELAGKIVVPDEIGSIVAKLLFGGLGGSSHSLDDTLPRGSLEGGSLEALSSFIRDTSVGQTDRTREASPSRSLGTSRSRVPWYELVAIVVCSLTLTELSMVKGDQDVNGTIERYRYAQAPTLGELKEADRSLAHWTIELVWFEPVNLRRLERHNQNLEVFADKLVRRLRGRSEDYREQWEEQEKAQEALQNFQAYRAGLEQLNASADIISDPTVRSTRGQRSGDDRHPNFVGTVDIDTERESKQNGRNLDHGIKHMIVPGFHAPVDDIDTVLYRGQHREMLVHDLFGVLRQFRYIQNAESFLRAHAPLVEPCVWAVQAGFVKNGLSGQNAAMYFDKVNVNDMSTSSLVDQTDCPPDLRIILDELVAVRSQIQVDIETGESWKSIRSSGSFEATHSTLLVIAQRHGDLVRTGWIPHDFAVPDTADNIVEWYFKSATEGVGCLSPSLTFV